MQVRSARVALLLCLALPTRTAVGQPRTSGRSVADSLQWRTQVITDTLLRRLDPVIAIVRQRGAGVPYRMMLPTDSSLAEWSRVRRILVDTLRAREATHTDSLVQVLSVEISRAAPTFAVIRLLVGAKWRCHGGWLGGSSVEEIVVPWDTAPPPPLVRVSTNSHSLPCGRR